jgi:hypothetical protein
LNASISGLNKFASTQLSHMPRRKLVLTGPMSVQPVEHGSITLNQSPSEKPTIDRPLEAGTKKQSARAEALRIAKAKITRRNSLQKQRRLLTQLSPSEAQNCAIKTVLTFGK